MSNFLKPLKRRFKAVRRRHYYRPKVKRCPYCNSVMNGAALAYYSCPNGHITYQHYQLQGKVAAGALVGAFIGSAIGCLIDAFANNNQPVYQKELAGLGLFMGAIASLD